MQTPLHFVGGSLVVGVGIQAYLALGQKGLCVGEQLALKLYPATRLLDVHVQKRQRVGVQPPEGVAAFVRVVSGARVIV